MISPHLAALVETPGARDVRFSVERRRSPCMSPFDLACVETQNPEARRE
jgi:hypothetical protein